ncbi:DUF4148 domain-containing protein [Paraburkholderia humisilvae]|uniref:DUF4148 domain-containing protein n=1 Tax=Paraburkholderia humisilvae TaxID=627669 RepID=A0A6J5F821_9BURK|nr:DUF4148 domain-containing protein [Paraburkholderia humisilvae]CAB3773647.1 hypothetical protein LMG29542_07364 [Paraburkholderia humisilvae]
MKTIAILVATAALAIPAVSFAQSANNGLTREQVRAELVQLQKVGYNPFANSDAHYPSGVQAAEAKVSATMNNGTSDTAKTTTSPSSCVGPVSFCNVYFGS